MTSIGATPVDGGGNRRQPTIVVIAIWTLIVGVMVMLALINPISRDEGAFMGPVAVASSARPYVDFLYLQTPLQAVISPPFAHLFPGYGFIALRCAIALMGAAVLGVTYSAQRGLGVSRRAAAACTALLAGCYSFQFGCGVVRNDALPALLAVTALQVGLLALRGGSRPAPAWGLAGLLFGAAASAKLSYAFPAAGAGLFLVIQLLRRRLPLQAVAAFGLGGLVGLIPCLIAWRQAPAAFTYGALTFNAATLVQWYRANHMGWVVSPAANVLVTTGILLVGPGLGALALVAGATVRRGWAGVRAAPHILLLDILIVAGLVAALAPTPSNFQYVLPALPALFIRLGVEAASLTRAPRRADYAAAGVMAFGLALGCGYGLVMAYRGLTNPGALPVEDVTRQAHWIGARLKAANASGFVSTLSPEVVLDSSYPLDPRFTTGVFVYRSAGLLTASELATFNSIGPQTLSRSLDQRPPAAIVVGGGGALDAALRSYAIAHGYRREMSPFGKFELDIPVS
ncbi:MAG: hypothetical protein P4L73_01685 [Caulobacteraceae bacterium]|nr:hypothetical protein [Caulobacteraceae bacterium]